MIVMLGFAALLFALLGLARAAAAANFPLYPIVTAPSWPAPSLGGLYLGDIRAHVRCPASATTAGGNATAQIWWRRRDPLPQVKGIIVKNADGTTVAFLPIYNNRENVLVHISPSGTVGMIEDNVVSWKIDGKGNLFFFRWESAGRPRTLLHWSADTGKMIIDDHVTSWEIREEGVVYFTDSGDENDGVEKSWLPESLVAVT